MFDKWDKRFIDMTELVGSWTSCFQDNRQVGAIIVRDRRIVTTGYNGAPAGVKSCREKGYCMRRQLGIPSGTQLERCWAIHAEQNALIQAAKLGISVEGCTIYVTHRPCSICARLIVNAGIKRVVYKHYYPDEFTEQIFKEAGMLEEQYEE